MTLPSAEQLRLEGRALLVECPGPAQGVEHERLSYSNQLGIVTGADLAVSSLPYGLLIMVALS